MSIKTYSSICKFDRTKKGVKDRDTTKRLQVFNKLFICILFFFD